VSQIAGLHHLQMYFGPGVSDFVGKSQESLIGLHGVIFGEKSLKHLVSILLF